MMTSTIYRRLLAPLFMLGLLMAATVPARADLASDLAVLNVEASALETQLEGITLSADSVCGPLNDANQAARDLVNSITAVEESLAAPLTVDAATMDAFDQLFVTGLGIANEALRLSVDLQTLSATADAITIKDGITAMLQLSDDIDTMADRIGAMSDKILVMADNIGLMADRIIQTQELQNQNVALTTQSILQTQTNALTLVSVMESASYDMEIATLTAQGMLLAGRMGAVMFHPWTMDDQMAAVAADVRSFLDDVKALETIINADAAASTMNVSATTMIELGNLSLMLQSLATAVDGYVIAIGGLAAITRDPTLYASMQSMLTLSGDIGVMANRILEMADQILVMADNIGLQADQILATQAAMNINVQTTQAALLGAQTFAINLIAARDL